jgi:hypothetical protein
MEKKEKSAIEIIKNQILNLIKNFCTQKLDDEYFQLSVKLLDKLGRKRDVPFMSGKIELWAAATIHALGTINFLFDKSFEPFVTIDEINDFFGTNKSTTGSKSKTIRDLLKLGYYNDEFSTAHMNENNPFNDMKMLNGIIFLKNLKPPLEPKMIEKKKVKKDNLNSLDLDLFSDL